MTALLDVERSLSLYYRALCGRSCALVPYDDDAELRQRPDTATTVRLPSHVHAGRADWAADWYKVAVTHRAMHHELGTFGLDVDRAEPFFVRLRPSGHPGGLDRFISLFPRTALAVEVFVALEDLRVDVAVRRTLPGLAASYDEVRADALDRRPPLSGVPARSAVAEALVRLSLGADTVLLPRALHGPAGLLAAAASVLADPLATVETTAEATIRCYHVLSHLPNLGHPGGPMAEFRFADTTASIDDPVFSLPGREMRLEGDEVFDVRFEPVRYRDVPGPRYLGQQASGMPLTEAILRMTDQDTADTGNTEDTDGFTERSLAAESGQVDVTTVERPPEPLPHDHGPDLGGHHHAEPGAVHATNRHEFAYPEWDHRAGQYLADWCLVKEARPRSGAGDRSYRQALSRNRLLLPALTAQLERMNRAGRRRISRLPYGDDLDLDACVEAMIDLRAGTSPSERVHTAMTEETREVVVAFALDLSSSTAERLPEDPARPGEVRRILDLEREAVALLLEAVERVGDSYGIYGFSGTGRKDVRLSVVKTLDEPRTPATLRRLDGLVPQHTTRMGPAIRHLSRRLAAHEAASKVLLVVSDGRPFDLDYGQQYGEDAAMDYALSDTARALAEARRLHVRPYLITVDPAGADYLGSMCHPDEYHVITDARELPAALARLYLVARETRGRHPRGE